MPIGRRSASQQAPVAAAYNHPLFRGQFVVGSLTMRGYWEPCRIAGAQARRVLMEAAAEKLGRTSGRTRNRAERRGP